MVVPSTKLEGLSDALEMTDVIIETAKQLKASLNQAKRANTPAALAAASATLGLARTVVTFSRDAHILLQAGAKVVKHALERRHRLRVAQVETLRRGCRRHRRRHRRDHGGRGHRRGRIGRGVWRRVGLRQ